MYSNIKYSGSMFYKKVRNSMVKTSLGERLYGEKKTGNKSNG
jgi:hypothetical protein